LQGRCEVKVAAASPRRKSRFAIQSMQFAYRGGQPEVSSLGLLGALSLLLFPAGVVLAGVPR